MQDSTCQWIVRTGATKCVAAGRQDPAGTPIRLKSDHVLVCAFEISRPRGGRVDGVGGYHAHGLEALSKFVRLAVDSQTLCSAF